MFKIFERAMKRGGHALETRRIRIKGMTSKNCGRTIKKALLTKNGVKEVNIDRQEGVATISFDPTQTDVTTLSGVIQRKGYFPDGGED